jgi:DNA-binding NtrC family response regulator
VRVLVAEDEPHLGTLLEQFLTGRGHAVTLVRDGRAALDALRTQEFDVALTDVQMPGPDGLALLAAARALPMAPEVIVATGNAAGETAVRALREGAYDAVAKPYRMVEVELLVRRAAEKRTLRRRALAARYADASAASVDDPALLALLALLARTGPTAPPHETEASAPLLLLGEPGTGRRTLARALHAGSGRAGAFVTVDCALLSAAEMRTRLLDGAAHVPPLTALAGEGTLCVLGAGRLERPLLEALLQWDTGATALVLLAGPGVRFASAASLPAPVRAIELTPLRERLADLPTIATRMAARLGGRALRLEDAAAALLGRRGWSGNLGELAAVVAAAVARVPADVDLLGPAAFLDAAP